MGIPSGMELLVILAIVVLLFGAKKIPDLAKGIGKGIKDFKKEMKDNEVADAKKIDAEESKTTETKTAEVKSTETTKQA
jgi:sec-independent protein translocase protein TatA